MSSTPLHHCPDCAPKHKPTARAKNPTKEEAVAMRWAPTCARLKMALRLRRAGSTLKECGDALGVSGSRAAQLIAQADRTERHGWKHRSEWVTARGIGG